MSRTIIQLFVCLLAVGRGSLLEYCTSPLKLCSDYCCGSSSWQYCCSSCYNSIFYHSECSSPTVYVPIATIIGSIISVIVFIIVVSVIVALCCGCICSNRTGIQRRGRVIRANQPNVTVVTTGVPNYQPGCPQPGYGTAYPVEAVPPPYPTNTNYGEPPKYNPGYMPEPK